jgi:class 3 adenylate cyclase
MTLPENMENATIAIVLTDIIGSTRFIQKHGNEVGAKWFSAHDRLVISCIAKHNGVLTDVSDGALMYFSTVEDAIAFGFEYRKKMKIHKFPFKSRIGIHFGDMLIVKTAEHLVRANHKRIGLEGIGKNIAARTMSICGPNQILLSKDAYIKFKARHNNNRFIPKNALIALVGLYKFKGVHAPEQVYAIGTRTEHMQPPPDGEKVKRIGGAKKIKTRMKHKRWSEIFFYFFYRAGLIMTIYLIYTFWSLLANPSVKASLGIDYTIFYPFEWIEQAICFIKEIIKK